MASHDDLNTPAIAVVGFIGAVIVVAIIVLLIVLFHRVDARQKFAKDVSQPYTESSKLTADQQGRLATYGWVDEKKKIAHIPVARAMDLVAAELSRDPNAHVTGVPDANPQTPPRTEQDKEEQEPQEPEDEQPKAQEADENAP